MNYISELLNISIEQLTLFILFLLVCFIVLFFVIADKVHHNSVIFIPKDNHKQSFLIKKHTKEEAPSGILCAFDDEFYCIYIKRVFLGISFYTGYFYTFNDDNGDSSYHYVSFKHINSAKQTINEIKNKVEQHHFDKKLPENKKSNTIEF